MSERVKRVCSAVKNDVKSRNPCETSENTAYAGVEGAFARERVCLKDDRPLGARGVWLCNDRDGDGGRVGRKGGEEGMPFFSFLGSGVFVALFFLALNGLKNDHSDSNCTESEFGMGELSSSAASSN